MDLEYFKPLEIPFKIFKFVGFYQTESSPTWYQIYGFLNFTLNVILTIFQIIPLIGASNILELSDVLCICFTYILLTLKSLLFILNVDKILNLIDEFRDLIQFVDQYGFGEKLKVRVKKAKSFFNTIWYSCLLSVNLAPILMILLSNGPPYRIPYVMWMPIDYEYNIYGYIITMIIEYLNPLIFCGVVCSLDVLPVFFFNLSSGLLEELSDRISKIDTILQFKVTEEKSIDEVMKLHDHALHEELKKCIEIHLKIRRLTLNSQNIFSAMIYIQAIVSSVILCTTAYSLSMASPLEDAPKFLQRITYIIPMILQIYIPCHMGNEVFVASKNLSMNIFHTNWSGGNRNFKNSIRMFITNAKEPILIISAKVFPVTLTSFMRISEIVYKLYALMQSMNN